MTRDEYLKLAGYSVRDFDGTPIWFDREGNEVRIDDNTYKQDTELDRAFASNYFAPGGNYGSLGYVRVPPELRQRNSMTHDVYERDGQVFKRIGDPGIFQNSWAAPFASNLINDPEYGYSLPLSTAEQLDAATPGSGKGDFKEALGLFAGTIGAPLLAGALGMPGFTGGGGSAFPAGAEGVIGGLGDVAGALPKSYWSMLADAGGVASDAAPAAAGALDFAPGTAGAFDAAGLGTGIDAGTMASTAGLGAGVTGALFPSISATPASSWSLSSFLNPTSLSTLGAGASLASGLIGAGAAKSASEQAAQASNNATAAQLGMFDTVNRQQAPYREAGYSALSSMLGGSGLGPASGGVSSGQFTRQFNADDLKTHLAPNYQFMLDQGLGAVKSAANLGGGIGGNTLKAINDYAQNYAGNAYQNAFNNYQAQQTNIFNRLSNIAGLGQTATTNTGNVGATISGNAANTMVGAGQAQAAGTIGQANAISGGLNNAFGWYALPQIMNAFTGSANA